jgi:hypothetical protein
MYPASPNVVELTGDTQSNLAEPATRRIGEVADRLREREAVPLTHAAGRQGPMTSFAAQT